MTTEILENLYKAERQIRQRIVRLQFRLDETAKSLDQANLDHVVALEKIEREILGDAYQFPKRIEMDITGAEFYPPDPQTEPVQR